MGMLALPNRTNAITLGAALVNNLTDMMSPGSGAKVGKADRNESTTNALLLLILAERYVRRSHKLCFQLRVSCLLPRCSRTSADSVSQGLIFALRRYHREILGILLSVARWETYFGLLRYCTIFHKCGSHAEQLELGYLQYDGFDPYLFSFPTTFF